MGQELSAPEVGELVQCLRRNKDVFAWSYSVMTGNDPKIACTPLNLDPTLKSIKQKKGAMQCRKRKNHRRRIGADVEYPKWLTNVLVGPKKNNK